MEITPIIGHWYKAANGTSRYIMELTLISDGGNFLGRPWRSLPDGTWYRDSDGGFRELIEEIPCPEEFKPEFIHSLIYN